MLRDIFYELLSKYEFDFARTIDVVYNELPNKDVVYDPVHGEITLTKELIYLLNFPIVERLAKIKQLALTYLRFIGATHTRLEHSLGVAYLLTNVTNDLDDNEKVLMNIAGLLHDIGHSGLGHALDGITGLFLGYLSRLEPKFVALPPNKLDMTIAAYLFKYNDQLAKAIDELAKIVFPNTVYNGVNLNEAGRFRDLLLSIISEEKYGYKVFCQGWEPTKEVIDRMWYFQNLLGGKVNCDRLDWILRDAHHAFPRHSIADRVNELRNLIAQLKVDQNTIGADHRDLTEVERLHSDIRRELYTEVYESVARAFTDAFLIRMAYSVFHILSRIGEKIASPTITTRVLLGYLLLPDDELFSYSERILDEFILENTSMLELDKNYIEYILNTRTLKSTIFKNIRTTLSTLVHAIDKFPSEDGIITVGPILVGKIKYTVVVLTGRWLAKNPCPLAIGPFLYQGEVKAILAGTVSFFNSLRIDIQSGLEIPKLEHRIRNSLREKQIRADAFVLANYYFLRKLSDEDLQKVLTSIDDFYRILDEKYNVTPIFFMVFTGDISVKYVRHVVDKVTNHFSSRLQNVLKSTYKKQS
jgi:HD superfamily phosphohydrolase